MFRLLRMELLHQVKIFNLNPTITATTTTTHLRFLQNPSAKTISHTLHSTNAPSLTVSYLMNSCGLSSEAALSVAQKFQLKTFENSDSVLELLKNHDFTNTQITSLITRYPRLLSADPGKTLKPKFEFYNQMGLFGPDLAKLIYASPGLLLWSVENRIIPNLDLLKTVLHTNENIVAALKKSCLLLLCDVRKVVLPKIKALRNYDVPMPVIKKLVIDHPRQLTQSSDRFDAALTAIKEMGIDPSTSTFAHAVGVHCGMTQSNLERKSKVFRNLGWSEDEILTAFKKHPFCMKLSDEKIRKSMEFFANKLKWGPAFISTQPALLSYSLDKRIIPRCSVLKILTSKGLMKGNFSARPLTISEKEFLEKYVIKYHDEVPEVVEAIRGKMGFVDPGMERRELEGNGF